MKGLLYQTDKGWIVRWSNKEEYKQTIHELPLDPNDNKKINDYLDNYYDDIQLFPFYHDNKEVEFQIEDYWETGLEQVIKIAKLI